jgi:flagellar biosynthetic protein FliQ
MILDIDLGTELIRRALMLVLIVSAPVLVCGLIVGVAASLLQAVTQIQEQTLSLVPKIAVTLVVGFVTLPWIGQHLMDFAREIFSQGLVP